MFFCLSPCKGRYKRKLNFLDWTYETAILYTQMEWSFRTVNTYKTLQTCAPINILGGDKFTSCQLPSRGTGPSETSIWNSSPLKILFCTLIGVILLNCKRLKNPKKMCPRKCPTTTQVYIVSTPREWARPAETSIWNTSPMNIIFFILIGVTLLNCKSLQKQKTCIP